MDYHDDYSAWSKTMLWHFRQSKLEAWHTYVTRKLPTKEMSEPALSGIVKHCIALEGASVDDLVLAYPEDCLNKNGGLIGKRAAAFRAEHAGAAIVKLDERQSLVDLTEQVLQTEELQAFIGKHAIIEEAFYAIIDDLPCKCKPDIVREYGDYLDVFDLKFPKVFSRESFERANKRFGYWFQRSHYVAVLEKCFDKPVRRFTFLNIESTFPFRVQPKYFDAINTIPAADTEHRKTIREIRECMESDNWADDWPTEVVMNPWDFGVADDNELVEVT